MTVDVECDLRFRFGPARDQGSRPTCLAFAASDFEGVCARLDSKKVKYRHQVIPRTGGRQVFLYDPDGVGVELNFPPPAEDKKSEDKKAA